MWYQVIQYFKFLSRSTNQHSVHSPFVYDLITKCFYDTSAFIDYKKLKRYKNSLLKNNSILAITDLGSGSRVTKNNNRKISQITFHSGTKLKRSKLLYRISNYFKPKTILELGTSLGIATQAMQLGNPDAEITTIEGCSNISDFTKQEFEKQGLKNTNMMVGNFSIVIPTLTSPDYDLIFFDGNHSKEGTLEYFNLLLPKVHNDSIFIFDDIYWSKGMMEAWEVIKNHKKVTVSIDTFFWGIIFFRKEQTKEHFTIRI